MWSAEMDPDDVVDAIPLSSDNRFKGHLHIRNISSIILDDALFPSRPLKMLDDSGDIFHLSVESEKVELQIIWEKWTPKCKETGFSTLLITGEEVYWEPDLDLVDPYW
jgi:hypothetical protein